MPANILTISVSLSNGSPVNPLALAKNYVVTQAGLNSTLETFTATTATLALPLGAVGTLGFICVINTDATNYVDLAIDSGSVNKFCRLLPGQGICLPAEPAITYYAKANTASCILAILAVE